MSSKLFGTYSFGNVALVIGGVPITGGADGDDAIMAERNTDVNAMVAGAGGDVVNIQSQDKTGIVTIKLLQTSPGNGVLSGLLKAQEAGVFRSFPIAIKDISNAADLVAARHCTVASWTPVTYGAGHNAREWRINCAELEIFVAGQVRHAV